MPLNFNPYVNQDPNAGQWVDKIVNTFFGIQQLNDARKQWQAEFEFKKDIVTEELEMKKEEFGMEKKLFERQFANLDKQIEMIDKTMAWLDIDIAAADKRGRIDNEETDNSDETKVAEITPDKINQFNKDFKEFIDNQDIASAFQLTVDFGKEYPDQIDTDKMVGFLANKLDEEAKALAQANNKRYADAATTTGLELFPNAINNYFVQPYNKLIGEPFNKYIGQYIYSDFANVFQSIFGGK